MLLRLSSNESTTFISGALVEETFPIFDNFIKSCSLYHRDQAYMLTHQSICEAEAYDAIEYIEFSRVKQGEGRTSRESGTYTTHHDAAQPTEGCCHW